MKSIIINVIAVSAILIVAADVKAAQTISFADALQGVDGTDFSKWSTDNKNHSLETGQWSLLNGAAQVNAYSNGDQAGILSHRMTRGLGVMGGSNNDEIDSYIDDRDERIEITFNRDYYLNRLEIRSLFDPDTGWDIDKEIGAVDFYLNTKLLTTQYLVGNEKLGENDNDGDVIVNYANPYLIDKRLPLLSI